MGQIVIIGPAYPLRGGLATFDQRLAEEFTNIGHTCTIVSFSLQYPSLFFPGKTQYTDEAPPKNIRIYTLINSVNPLNWLRVGRRLQQWRPDIIVVRFWMPFMGPCLGTILRLVRRNRHTRIICIADNVVPHEHRPGDRALTSYFLKGCDGFITMSESVKKDLLQFGRKENVQLVQHPLYDNFGEVVPKGEARQKIGIQGAQKIILFFGFVRKYKGLDLLLQAMSDERIKREGIKLLIAGEFYEDEAFYRRIIKEHKLEDAIIMRNNFIPDSEVKYYLCAADCVVQPYRSATQSGVTPLAYHFEKPMIVTNVGGLPSLVPHKKAGLICEPQPAAIADAVLLFYGMGEDHFIPFLRTEKLKYSWSHLVNAIKNGAAEIHRA